MDHALGWVGVVDAGESASGRFEAITTTATTATRGAIAVGLLEFLVGVAIHLTAARSEATSAATWWAAVNWHGLWVLRCAICGGGVDAGSHAATAAASGAICATEGAAVRSLEGSWGGSGDELGTAWGAEARHGVA